MSDTIILDLDQVEELRRVLGTVEDWLLHTSFEVLDDLGGFLASIARSTTAPERLVTWLISDLGEQTIMLRPAHTSTAAAATASS